MDYHETTLRDHQAREDAEIAEAARLNEIGLDRLESLARGYLRNPADIVEAARDAADEDTLLASLAGLALRIGDADTLRKCRLNVAGACVYMAYWNLPADEQEAITCEERDALAAKISEVIP